VVFLLPVNKSYRDDWRRGFLNESLLSSPNLFCFIPIEWEVRTAAQAAHLI
jgi:hypothetical protein